MITTAIVLTVLAALAYGGLVLWGAVIDGRRQALRNRGLHPTTTDEGVVEPQERMRK